MTLEVTLFWFARTIVLFCIVKYMSRVHFTNQAIGYTRFTFQWIHCFQWFSHCELALACMYTAKITLVIFIAYNYALLNLGSNRLRFLLNFFVKSFLCSGYVFSVSSLQHPFTNLFWIVDGALCALIIRFLYFQYLKYFISLRMLTLCSILVWLIIICM